MNAPVLLLIEQDAFRKELFQRRLFGWSFETWCLIAGQGNQASPTLLGALEMRLTWLRQDPQPEVDTTKRNVTYAEQIYLDAARRCYFRTLGFVTPLR